MRLCLPNGTSLVKMTSKFLPEVPVLVNLKPIPANTRLLALDDPVVLRAREEDKKDKEEEKKVKEAEQKASAEQEQNPKRRRAQ